MIRTGLILLLLSACPENEPEPSPPLTAPTPVEPVQATPSALPMPEPAPTSEAEAAPAAEPVDSDDFATFWTAFRALVVAENWEAVAQMTRFPLRTRGPYDSHPTIPRPEERFVDVITKFLAQSTGLPPQGETEAASVERLVAPPDDAVTGRDARVNGMEFKLVDGAWRLSFLYLDEDVIEAL